MLITINKSGIYTVMGYSWLENVNQSYNIFAPE